MVFEYILDPLHYSFMVRSLIVATLVGLMLPLLGAYVINRNLAFMGDALAHASLPSLVLGLLIGTSIFIAAIPAAIIVAVLVAYIFNKSDISEDTAVGIIFSSLFALGLILLSIYDEISFSLEDLLLGQLLAVSHADVLVTIYLTLLVIITLLIMHKQFLFSSFDPFGAKVMGLKVDLLNYLFLIILSLAIIGSLQSVGVVLVLSMLITPAATSKLLVSSFSGSMILGSAFGVMSTVTGLYVSYYLNFPSGPSMALTSTCVFVIVWVSGRILKYGQINK